MKTALFTNFTNEVFNGYWDGKKKPFAPGQSLYMPDYLAKHFAKHLVNQELLKRKEDGSLVYKDGEKFVSPKKPEEVPIFMELFNKAFTPDETEELGDKKDDIDTLINVANKNKNKEKESPQDPTKPQIIVPPDFDDEDSDNEESFQGHPVDEQPSTTKTPVGIDLGNPSTTEGASNQ